MGRTLAEKAFEKMPGCGSISMGNAEIHISVNPSSESQKVKNESFDLIQFVIGKHFRKLMYKSCAARHMNYVLNRDYFDLIICENGWYVSDYIATYRIFFKGGCRISHNWIVGKAL